MQFIHTQMKLLPTPMRTMKGLVLPLLSSLVPRPFLVGGVRKGKGRKGPVNNLTLTQIYGCIPAVSVDEGKRECQVGMSRE